MSLRGHLTWPRTARATAHGRAGRIACTGKWFGGHIHVPKGRGPSRFASASSVTGHWPSQAVLGSALISCQRNVESRPFALQFTSNPLSPVQDVQMTPNLRVRRGMNLAVHYQSARRRAGTANTLFDAYDREIVGPLTACGCKHRSGWGEFRTRPVICDERGSISSGPASFHGRRSLSI
jgi:hypothetical protein